MNILHLSQLLLIGGFGFIFNASTSAQTTYTVKPQITSPANQQNNSNDTRLDINNADVKQLMTLKGVSESEAKRIVATRPHRDIDSLVYKEAITLDKLKAIKPHIRLN